MVNTRSTRSPTSTEPPTAFASGTVIDIARKFGELATGAPSGPMKLAGITTNDGFFGSANFVGRIGSPTLMLWIFILPSASSALVLAAVGFASALESRILRSPYGKRVL